MLIRSRHLLGKKSWNVYNADNIARVQRDEEEAKLRETENEKQQRANDADTRLAQLRGTDHGDLDVHTQAPTSVADEDSAHRAPKKRKLRGEDDIDHEMRLARQSKPQHEISEASALGSSGHLDLIPRPGQGNHRGDDRGSKGAGVPATEGGIRMADAAGYGKQSAQPWYSSARQDGGFAHDSSGKDVWGNEDPRRQQREKKRMDTNDPLAAIKKGVKQLRQAETQRKEWREQRERDLGEVEELARRDRRCRKRERSRDKDSFDGFDLDAGYARDQPPASKHETGGSTHHHRRHHRRRHRSRDRSRSRT